MAAKEWTHVRRDPRSLIVALVLPIVLLVLMGEGINFDLTKLPFALCDYDQSLASRALRETLVNTELFRLHGAVRSAEEGERMVQSGDCLFVLVIPAEMQADLLRGREVRLQMILDGSDSNTASIARQYLMGALVLYAERLAEHAAVALGLSANAVKPPIVVERKVLYNPSLDSQQFIVPGLIVVILVILGTLLTSGAVVRERESGTFETLAASPLAAPEILLGKLLPYLGVGIADIIIAVCTGALVFDVKMAGSVPLFLGCGVVFLLCALSLGLLFSTIARSQQLAMVAAFISTLLPTLFLSGFVFPIRNMPLVLRAIANIIPATHFLRIARPLYLKGVGLEVCWTSLLILAGLSAAIFAVSARRFRKQL
jgi:ABC-2 type transport system permease protein